MPLQQLHVLLTYTCNFECDHCFVYSGPGAPGILTIGQVRTLLEQAQRGREQRVLGARVDGDLIGVDRLTGAARVRSGDFRAQLALPVHVGVVVASAPQAVDSGVDHYRRRLLAGLLADAQHYDVLAGVAARQGSVVHVPGVDGFPCYALHQRRIVHAAPRRLL